MVLADGCCSWHQGLAVRLRQSEIVIVQHVREEEEQDHVFGRRWFVPSRDRRSAVHFTLVQIR